MKFSSLEEYGLRCLLQVATNGDDSVTIGEIAKREALSEPYVAKLLMILRKGGFIKSERGQLGGYRLARDPETIPIGEVLRSLGGKLIEKDFCDRFSGIDPTCVHKGHCTIRPLWNAVQSAVDDVVARISLADLMKANGDCSYDIILYPSRPESPVKDV